MPEKNPCTGCGQCCENITGYDAEEVVTNTFPQAKEVSTWEMQKIIDGNGKKGVFYTYDGRAPESGMVIFRINGACENRQTDGSCGRYKRCSHASENFQPGSHECNKIRIQAGLEAI